MVPNPGSCSNPSGLGPRPADPASGTTCFSHPPPRPRGGGECRELRWADRWATGRPSASTQTTFNPVLPKGGRGPSAAPQQGESRDFKLAGLVPLSGHVASE